MPLIELIGEAQAADLDNRAADRDVEDAVNHAHAADLCAAEVDNVVRAEAFNRKARDTCRVNKDCVVAVADINGCICAAEQADDVVFCAAVEVSTCRKVNERINTFAAVEGSTVARVEDEVVSAHAADAEVCNRAVD